MPELDEGNLYIRGVFPISISFQEMGERTRQIRAVLREYPEVEAVVSQIGRPDDGTDPTGYYNVEIFVPLLPRKEWPAPRGRSRPRTKEELVHEVNARLER